jgi:hypothetical protein
MRTDHVNNATLAGEVQDFSCLRRDRAGRQYLEFNINTSRTFELLHSFDLTERHRCLARGELAEQLADTITDGTTLRVIGAIRVNSFAVKRLDQLIARVAVEQARVLNPAPAGSRRLLAKVAPTRASEVLGYTPDDFARNEVHLVGTVVKVDLRRSAARLAIRTHRGSADTHDILVWKEEVPAEALRIGALAEIRGVLQHHVTPWNDGQVRLMSTVERPILSLLEPAPSKGHSRSTGLLQTRADQPRTLAN